MKIIRVLTILSLAFLIQLIVSCCNCNASFSYKYSDTGLTVKNLDNTGPHPVESNDTIFNKMAYGIRMLIGTKTISGNKINIPFNFSNASAFDCRCRDEIIYVAQDSIVSLKIITKNDFDSAHAANSDIAQYFKVYEYYQFSSIPDFIKKPRTSYDFNNSVVIQADLVLINEPIAGSRHQFSVEMTLSDGRVFKAETKAVELK